MDLLVPVSVKGVLIEGGAVVLLENERDEWELPGGRLERGETPQECLIREFQEELGTVVQVGPLLDAWMFEVLPERFVFIVAYAVFRHEDRTLTVSDEHKRMQWWSLDTLPGDALPAGYRRAISLARQSPRCAPPSGQ